MCLCGGGPIWLGGSGGMALGAWPGPMGTPGGGGMGTAGGPPGMGGGSPTANMSGEQENKVQGRLLLRMKSSCGDELKTIFSS